MAMASAAWYRRYSGLIFGILALVIVLVTLFGGDDIGLSNNGDFGRVMQACGLTFGDTFPQYTYAGEYTVVSSGRGPAGHIAHLLFSREGLDVYPSIHVAFVRGAVALEVTWNTLLGRDPTVFRIGVLGVLYALWYAAGIGLLCQAVRLSALWKDAVFKLVLLLILCDVGYTAYFNSLYGEALEHVALVWCAAFSARLWAGGAPVRAAAGCALSALVYGWAKFFDLPIAILFAAVTAGAAFFLSGKKPRALVPGALAILLLLGIWTLTPDWMSSQTECNSLFFGILRDTDETTARRYLADMSLDEELAAWRDTNYYTSGAVEDMAARGLWDAVEAMGKGDIIRFYLTHPARLIYQMKLTAMHCGMVRPWYLANCGPEHPYLTLSGRMSLWSRIREAPAFRSLPGAAAMTAAFFLLAAGRSPRRAVWPLAALAGALCYAFAMPVILNGEGDLAKHMFAYIELFDMLPAGCVLLLLEAGPASRWSRAGGAALLAAVLILPVLAQPLGAAARARTRHTAPEVGAYVRLGSYDGQPLFWMVAGTDGGRLTLLCLRDDISAPFDTAGRNDWRGCSARGWLTGEFMACFSDEEKALLVSAGHPLILPDGQREEAESGEAAFSCSHIAVLADRGCVRAYQTTAADTVRLPDIHMISDLARRGLLSRGAPFWLDTPYCPRPDMVRFADAAGYIRFAPADIEMALRPVVTVASGTPFTGSGSVRDPFILG